MTADLVTSQELAAIAAQAQAWADGNPVTIKGIRQELAAIAAQAQADLEAEIAAGHIELQPSRWTVISGGVPGFVNANDPDQTVKAIDGVILAYQPVRTLWDQNTPQGVKAVPLCKSADGAIGEPQSSLVEFGGSMEPRPCAGCVFDRWGTGKGGRGKACKQKEAVVVYPLDEEIEPLIIYAPPTSLGAFKQYKAQLAGGNHPASKRLATQDGAPAWAKGLRKFVSWFVVTRLETERRGTGQEAFSVMKFTPLSLVPDELAVKIRGIRQEWGIKVAQVEAEMFGDSDLDAGPFPAPDTEGVPF
jgi:hypothetical protein